MRSGKNNVSHTDDNPARAVRHSQVDPAGGALGFTLIELMITLAIFAVLSAIAVPQFTSMINNQRVKVAVGDLHASLTFARSEAIKRSAFVGVCAKTDDSSGCQNSSDWARGWIVFLDADGNGLPGAVSDILKRQEAIPTVTLTGTNSNVSYTRDGRLRATVATFVANTSASNARCVSLDLGGRPSIKADTDQNVLNGCQ